MLNSLIVTAGLSKRMGKFKPLLLYKDKPIIITIIEKLKEVSNKIFIITGFREEELIAEIDKYFDKNSEDKITFVSNPEFEKGMFTSLQAGLIKAKECDWLLYHFADQPQLSKSFYSELVSHIDDKFDWVQPAFKERKGHPVLIKKTLFKILIEAGENSSLKE
jgi:molybdenum cofactor cytidylyltransferase